MRYVILGTAGHIDHGKSALVKALTGTDPDRLKEEKERGITIDLGFADLTYPDGLKVGIVDVPGHERLVKNMLAGAGGIDIVLMVIAADEGIMPQSREHLAICNLLKVKRGMIVVTKSDLVEKEWLDLVADDIKNFVEGSFLEGAEVIAVSSKTGDNIELLKDRIREIALGLEPKPAAGIFRLPVDRVFTLRGFGTVVTGTAVSGKISLDASVEILPEGIKTKVRGLQSHGEEIKTAYAGQRVAINLQGVSKHEIQRGDVIIIPDKIKSSYVIDAEIELLKDSVALKNRSLLHFHTGTSELTGRIIIYDRKELKTEDRAFCQFRFSKPLTVMAGDRYIVRRFSPLETIGGGEVIDSSPKHRKKNKEIEDLKILKQGGLKEKLSIKILQKGLNGVTLSDLEGWIKAELPEISAAINSLTGKGEIIQCEGRLLHKKVFDDFSGRVISTLKGFHEKNPLKQGMLKEALRFALKGINQKLFDGLFGLVKEAVVEKEVLRLKTFKVSLSEDKKVMKDKILKVVEDAKFQPPSDDELAKSVKVEKKEAGELLKIMALEGNLIRIKDSVYISKSNYARMMERLKEFYSTKSEMSVAEFRDILGTSRKYALPFLEYLDSHKITLRVGDVRKFVLKE